jgi:hypothetical protein
MAPKASGSFVAERGGAPRISGLAEVEEGGGAAVLVVGTINAIASTASKFFIPVPLD